jgi:hypothetical protein
VSVTKAKGFAGLALASVVLSGVALAAGSENALAATSGTGTATFTVTGGSLSLASVGTAAFAVTLSSGTVTTAATNLNVGTYADTTGSGAGWNGTLALQQFVNTQAWVPTGTALNSNASGVYTGTTLDANYQVTVSSDGGTTVAVAWTGTESGSGTATKGSAFTVGTKGITITFKSGSTYLTTDSYAIKADVLATSAMVMATGGSCTATGTTATGANIPSMTNTASTVTGGTYNTFGSAIKVITAPAGFGLGTFTCTPKSTLSVDSNTAIPGSYTASAQFTIATGP